MNDLIPKIDIIEAEGDATSVSPESQLINRYMEDLTAHYFEPITRQWANPAIRFFTLKSQWEKETAVVSSVTQMAMHPSYQQIIGMGPAAIPLILNEMAVKPGHWFWALKSISGEDPVPPENRGRVREMTEAWLHWGREQNYL